jgi:hypothetical protein
MQQSQQSVFQLNKGAGHFNILSPDLNGLLVAQLLPKDKNTLRTTCKAFSNFLSFCNASRFILYPGFCAANKDISSIFAVATFDKNYQLIEGICQKYSPNNHHYSCIDDKCIFIYSSKITCSNIKNKLIISPYSIACYNNDSKMIKLLEKYLSNCSSIVASEKNFSELTVMPKNLNFLIACISRNTQKILLEMKNIALFDDKSLGFGLATIIDNDDSQSLRAIMKDKIINAHIKKKDTDFLDLAIFSRRNKAAEVLITSKYSNFNKIVKKIFWGTDDKSYYIYNGTYLDLLNSLDYCFEIDPSIFCLLRENEAKTYDELTIGEYCPIQ